MGRRAGGLLQVTVDRRRTRADWRRAAGAGRDEACAGRWSPCTPCSPSTTAPSCRLLEPPDFAAEAVAGLPQRRHVPGADRATRARRRRRAVVADHPLRLPGGGAREPGRLLRRDRDRRDPRAAGAHPDRRREGRGPRHRSRGRRPSSTAATTCRPRSGSGCTARSARSALRPRRRPAQPEPLPWWDPGVDGAVDPWTDTVVVGGVEVGKGTRSCCDPSRRADAHDLFLAGQHGHRGRRVPRRRRRRARGGHPRRRPGDRAARVAGAVPATSTPTRSRC